jgi:hypothetical protein
MRAMEALVVELWRSSAAALVTSVAMLSKSVEAHASETRGYGGAFAARDEGIWAMFSS